MDRTIALTATLALTLLFSAPASHAATEWTGWSIPDSGPGDALGSFADGRTITWFGNRSSFKAPNTIYTADPIIPGQPDGGNPPYILGPTGAPGETIADGDLIAAFDLTGFPVDSETVFGIADMVEPALYRIEILDAADSPLALTGIQVSNYNLFYPNTLIGDYNILLDPATGVLSVDPTHDANAGSTYVHSGLTLFSNLPAETEMIRILSAQEQTSEGIQHYFGASASVIPLPGAAWLFVGGLLTLGGFSRRSKSAS